MRYHGTLIRPPSEADSYILQVTFVLPEPAALLRELRLLIDHLDGLSRCIFRTNHASNYLPLAGTLGRDKARPAG